MRKDLFSIALSIIVGIIAGVVSGVIVGKIIGKSLASYHGPNSETIKGQIFTNKNGCYQMVPTPFICPVLR